MSEDFYTSFLYSPRILQNFIRYIYLHDQTVIIKINAKVLLNTLFRYTAYYLRLTADLYPSISAKLEESYPHLIPEIGGEMCEAE